MSKPVAHDDTPQVFVQPSWYLECRLHGHDADSVNVRSAGGRVILCRIYRCRECDRREDISPAPVAPDDTPTPHVARTHDPATGLCTRCGRHEPNHDPKCIHFAYAMSHREPDDTPTRLQHFIRQHQHGNCHILSKGDACECALCDLDRLLADVSRLQQENGLLKRSLEMLTKQLDEKDERIVELETLTQM